MHSAHFCELNRPSILRLIPFAIVLSVLLVGCESSRKDVAPPVDTIGLAEEGELLDGFEGQHRTVWAFDSADDEADATYVAEGATQGEKALHVTLRKKGLKGKIHLRREVAWDLSAAQALSVDVKSPAPGFSVALALKVAPGDVYQESKPVALKSGLNRRVRFPLVAPNWKNADSDWQFGGGPINLGKVHRVMLLLFTNEEESGSFLLDNLRLEGKAREALRAWRPEFVAVTPLKTGEQYTPLEVGAAFRASYEDLFDGRDLTMGMRVRTPSGKMLEVRGFFAGVMKGEPQKKLSSGPLPPFWGPFSSEDKNTESEKRPEAADRGIDKETSENEAWPLWVIRFTPSEVGRHMVQLWVRNRVGETRLPERGLVVVPQDAKRALPGRRGGSVRVSTRDPRQFELQDGSPFFAFGQNVAWATDWEPYLKRIAAYGGNCCRVWLCPWGLNLERKTDPGILDLSVARRIDRLLEQAEKTGVRIVFCLTYHGATTDFWHDTPYGQANGGPCARPQDFFTDRGARKQFKLLIRYAVARWSASPALMSWEVINEADLAGFGNGDEMVGWIAEMSSYIKRIDPHKHLVTVSTVKPEFQPRMWLDPNVDFVSAHGYGKDVANVLVTRLSPRLTVFKPFVLAEFGGGWRPITDASDPKGIRLQTALWLTACSPSAGTALPWWWDTQVEAHKLYGRFEALGRFLKGEDRRGRFRKWVRGPLADTPGVEVHGVMDERGARLYIFRPGWVRHLDSRGKAFLAAPAKLQISGVLDGKYRVEVWDAREGKMLGQSEADARNGALELKLAPREWEFALKIDRVNRLPLSLGP